ncbi:uncharacterized protein LOC117104401 [Anneissia japonica]|uniref:uncharacterized protein LOC117104401 n=1 Tax=Anneissia japonica TaxID=1529436 RepID=UPI001425A3C0|nr:uncharacterized protein LOC117104401 [Anneissia japonica]XP_033101130.1 uncharacterized protein LOC117104401 [Anneissia japonica]
MFVLWLFISAFHCANADDAGYMVLASDRESAKIFYSCLKTEDQPLNLSKSIALPVGATLRGIAYDQVGDKVYWSDKIEKKVFRMDMDGTNIEEIYSTSYVNCMEIDALYRQLYYFSRKGRLMRVYNISNGDHLTLFTFTFPDVFDLQIDGNYRLVFT